MGQSLGVFVEKRSFACEERQRLRCVFFFFSFFEGAGESVILA